MARFFKRRAKPGPSKNEQRVMRGRDAANKALSAGRISELFPTVERMSLQLDILTPQSQPFGQEQLKFGPGDACDFSIPCPGRCSSGSYDLSKIVSSAVGLRQSHSESSVSCQLPLYAGSPEVCGYQLRCKLELSFLPEKAPVPDGN